MKPAGGETFSKVADFYYTKPESLGETQDETVQVHFKEVSEFSILHRGEKIKTRWNNGKKQTSPVLQGWEYQGGSGEPPVLFGVNVDSGTYETFPIRELKSIDFRRQIHVRNCRVSLQKPGSTVLIKNFSAIYLGPFQTFCHTRRHQR